MAMTHLTNPSRWFRRGRTPAVSNQSTEPAFEQEDPVLRMHDEMNRLVNRFFGDPEWGFTGSALSNGNMAAVMQPQLDIFESDKDYRLSVELPGVDRDSIDLSVDEDALIISARKERKVTDSDTNQFHRVERRYGRFERMLTLPMDADGDNISAEFTNGVLEVVIPRRQDIETTRGRKVEVKGD